MTKFVSRQSVARQHHVVVVVVAVVYLVKYLQGHISIIRSVRTMTDIKLLREM